MSVAVMMLVLLGAVFVAVLWRVITRRAYSTDKIPNTEGGQLQSGRTSSSTRGAARCITSPASTSLAHALNTVTTVREEESSSPTQEAAPLGPEPEGSTQGERRVSAEHTLSPDLEEAEAGSKAPKLNHGVSDTVSISVGPKDESQSAASDVSQQEQPEGPNQAEKPKSLEPDKRGGRSRGLATGEDRAIRESTPRTPKPDIICWKREQEWILAVELPESVQQAPGLALLENGVPLIEDEFEQGCWRLAHLKGEVYVRCEETGTGAIPTILLGDGDYQLFKLAGHDLTRGRRVKQVSLGSYLVVVPANWERDEQRAGLAPASPEPTSLDGYRAHFFDLSDDQFPTIAFRDASDRSFVIAAAKEPFRLVGQELPDACETQGSLFVCTIPRIQILNGSWENVATIVLGEERPGAGKWRKSFTPSSPSSEQAMPADLVERKAGWYFLRFYDREDELIDSFDFRFAAGLREVKIAKISPLPREGGHQSAAVEFHHDADWHVAASVVISDVSIERSSGQTILKIPPAPERDCSEWNVGPRQGPAVNVVVLVERVWWAVGNANFSALRWQDSCLSVQREDFKATSEKMLWLRLPKRRWMERVLIGFRLEMCRSYSVRAIERHVAVPLRDFCDSQEVVVRTKDQFLRLWIEWNGIIHEVALAVIHADMPLGELKLDAVPLTRLAQALTELRRFASGPAHKLLKETRRRYRRPQYSSADQNDEFVRCGLCAIALFLQLAEARKSSIPKSARRWKARAQMASEQFPEIMRELWVQYSRLEGHEH